jgi:hypothetical protein
VRGGLLKSALLLASGLAAEIWGDIWEEGLEELEEIWKTYHYVGLGPVRAT